MIRLLPIFLLVGCDTGLASLWQAPVRVDAGPVLSVAPVVGLTGRLGLAASASQPDRLEPAPGDRLRPVGVKALGQGLWLVRTQRQLYAPGDLSVLSSHLGKAVTYHDIERGLQALPRSPLGLSLDRHLRIVADRSGADRRGTVVSCSGDPVRSKLHLMACLALGHGQPPEIGIEPPRPQPDAGMPVVWDAAPVSNYEAGGTVRSLDAGLDTGLRRDAP